MEVIIKRGTRDRLPKEEEKKKEENHQSPKKKRAAKRQRVTENIEDSDIIEEPSEEQEVHTKVEMPSGRQQRRSRADQQPKLIKEEKREMDFDEDEQECITISSDDDEQD